MRQLFYASYKRSAECAAPSSSVSSAPKTICRFVAQKRYMSTPRTGLRADGGLDESASRDFQLRPIFKIRDFILGPGGGTVKLMDLNARSDSLGLKNQAKKAIGFIKRHPNIFEIFIRSGDPLPCVRLSKAVLDLVEEEKLVFMEIEAQVLLKLRKMLMMSQTHRIAVEKLQYSRRCLGLPPDFATRVVPSYPQYFRVIDDHDKPLLELVEWNERLAISELERKRKELANNGELVDIMTRGRSLESSLSYSPGIALQNEDLLETWQTVPYTSPYQDASRLKCGTLLFDKRVIAVLHEILSLTVEKKALLRTLGHFNKEFGMPHNIRKAIRCVPGVFYLTWEGADETVFLKEGYDRAQLLEDHPLIRLKNKYLEMALQGRSCNEEGNENGDDSEHYDSGDSDYDSEKGDDVHAKKDVL